MEKENQNNTQSIMKNLEEMTRAKFFKKAIFVVLALVFLAGAFSLGVAVGYRKANFSYKWGENYHKNFGGPMGGFMGQAPMMRGGDFINSHGTTGTIIKIDGNNLIVDGQGIAEKTIVVSEKTVIRRGAQDIKIVDLKVGDLTVIIGNPNSNGQIDASLIRVFGGQ